MSQIAPPIYLGILSPLVTSQYRASAVVLFKEPPLCVRYFVGGLVLAIRLCVRLKVRLFRIRSYVGNMLRTCDLGSDAPLGKPAQTPQGTIPGPDLEITFRVAFTAALSPKDGMVQQQWEATDFLRAQGSRQTHTPANTEHWRGAARRGEGHEKSKIERWLSQGRARIGKGWQAIGVPRVRCSDAGYYVCASTTQPSAIGRQSQARWPILSPSPPERASKSQYPTNGGKHKVLRYLYYSGTRRSQTAGSQLSRF
ncbi:hypothetical protein B0T17DRAFT_511664 [Bombardia bombarda]|uniref:Uncharacterized protein n=1 Tax=Bombardia bombarda TaxID=252184 RepID=A0AA39W4T8_9PEZI|nr:hypothetical protein B0T17DRAFT_511664 [Bombardia bombarda]